jgi:hypothetical protein
MMKWAANRRTDGYSDVFLFSLFAEAIRFLILLSEPGVIPSTLAMYLSVHLLINPGLFSMYLV